MEHTPHSNIVQFKAFKNNVDKRGSLIAIESNKNIPFEIKRIYYLFNNASNTIRAQHAHKKLKQVYIATSGSCKLKVDNGKIQEIITLNRPDIGVIFDKIIWRELFDFTPDCVLTVLADELYDKDDYIDNYQEFLDIKNNDRI